MGELGVGAGGRICAGEISSARPVPAVIYNRKYKFLLYVKQFSDAKKLVLEDNL